MPWKFVIELTEEKNEMDSGCIHSILQECTNHGAKITKAEYIALDDGHINNLMHFLDGIEPEQDKC